MSGNEIQPSGLPKTGLAKIFQNNQIESLKNASFEIALTDIDPNIRWNLTTGIFDRDKAVVIDSINKIFDAFPNDVKIILRVLDAAIVNPNHDVFSHLCDRLCPISNLELVSHIIGIYSSEASNKVKCRCIHILANSQCSECGDFIKSVCLDEKLYLSLLKSSNSFINNERHNLKILNEVIKSAKISKLPEALSGVAYLLRKVQDKVLVNDVLTSFSSIPHDELCRAIVDVGLKQSSNKRITLNSLGENVHHPIISAELLRQSAFSPSLADRKTALTALKDTVDFVILCGICETCLFDPSPEISGLAFDIVTKSANQEVQKFFLSKIVKHSNHKFRDEGIRASLMHFSDLPGIYEVWKLALSFDDKSERKAVIYASIEKTDITRTATNPDERKNIIRLSSLHPDPKVLSEILRAYVQDFKTPSDLKSMLDLANSLDDDQLKLKVIASCLNTKKLEQINGFPIFLESLETLEDRRWVDNKVAYAIRIASSGIQTAVLLEWFKKRHEPKALAALIPWGGSGNSENKAIELIKFAKELGCLGAIKEIILSLKNLWIKEEILQDYIIEYGLNSSDDSLVLQSIGLLIAGCPELKLRISLDKIIRNGNFTPEKALALLESDSHIVRESIARFIMYDYRSVDLNLASKILEIGDERLVRELKYFIKDRGQYIEDEFVAEIISKKSTAVNYLTDYAVKIFSEQYLEMAPRKFISQSFMIIDFKCLYEIMDEEGKSAVLKKLLAEGKVDMLPDSFRGSFFNLLENDRLPEVLEVAKKFLMSGDLLAKIVRITVKSFLNDEFVTWVIENPLQDPNNEIRRAAMSILLECENDAAKNTLDRIRRPVFSIRRMFNLIERERISKDMLLLEYAEQLRSYKNGI